MRPRRRARAFASFFTIALAFASSSCDASCRTAKYATLAEYASSRQPRIAGASCALKLSRFAVAGCGATRADARGALTVVDDDSSAFNTGAIAVVSLQMAAALASSGRARAFAAVLATRETANANDTETETHAWRTFALTDARHVPFVYMNPESSARALELARSNRGKTRFERRAFASVSALMDALGRRPTIDPPNSSMCLRLRSCLPIGGYSVVASAPTIGASERDVDERPAIVVVAKLDADGFFRDATYATNERMSALVVLLGTAKVVGRALGGRDSSEATRVVAFAALAGEDFGAIGSDRVAREFAKDHSVSVLPSLAGRAIDKILEIDAVGFAKSRVKGDGSATMYASVGASDDSSALADVVERALNEGEYELSFARASERTSDGVDRAFARALKTNDYAYARVSENPGREPMDAVAGSPLDVGLERSVDVARVREAIDVISTTVLALVLNIETSSAKALIDSAVGDEATEELTRCLLDDAVGLASCALGREYVFGDVEATTSGDSSTGAKVLSVYPDVIPALDVDEQSHENKNAMARFAWNYLARATASATGQEVSCENDGSCPAIGTVCVGKTVTSVGSCVVSAPRYVIALSTRLRYDAVTGAWSIAEATDAFERDSPLWTESNWQLENLGGYFYTEPSLWDRLIVYGFSVATIFFVWAYTRWAFPPRPS